MASRIKGHRVVAILVLVVATAWVGTGEFAAVGSKAAGAQSSESEAAKPVEAPVVKHTVSVITPTFKEHAREIRISGVTDPDKKALLAARTSGVIATLDIKKGDAVAAGSVIMTLEGPDVVAGLAVAKVALDQRERELSNAETLFKRGNTSETQLIASRSAEAAAKAQVSQAQAAVDRLTLIAPFSGLVDSIAVELGEWVQTGMPIATVLALDPIVVNAEVSETDVRELKTGSKAHVHLVNGDNMEGTVRFISAAASEQTRTFPVEIALPNPGREIPAGMTTNVSLFAAPVRSVTVPRSVLTLLESGVIGLRVVGPDNVAKSVPVDLIDDTPDGMVLTGVPEGVRIVVAGQDLVKDGETVNVDETSLSKADPKPAAALTAPPGGVTE
ncbi:efflux RND transporter periplasmic adaptor subunit [Pseudorhodobacter sp.]|uniref:efflux RND transporter periplasmic adaptor subunit n=1 Tax=Pseudorhodobacter sp. TaxID=1934400 RepID=UPI002647D37D|nr:efflux RND transporter periplasmic adaptor subunit [Pseudorhodobacter sp.]MDN5786173.1 efflux RND transporter periplasmic adaptor subunit [Pseudorhodobacter sp.]